MVYCTVRMTAGSEHAQHAARAGALSLDSPLASVRLCACVRWGVGAACFDGFDWADSHCSVQREGASR